MKKILLALLGAGLVLFSACNDDDKSNSSRVWFYLTDIDRISGKCKRIE